MLLALAAASCISPSAAAVLDMKGPWSPGPAASQWVREVQPDLFAMVSLTGTTRSALPTFNNDGTFLVSGDPATNPFLTYTLSLHRKDSSGSLVSLLPGEFTSVRIEIADIDSFSGVGMSDVWGLAMPNDGLCLFPSSIIEKSRLSSLPDFTQFSLREDLWHSGLNGVGPIGSDDQKDFSVTVSLPSFEQGRFVFGVSAAQGTPQGSLKLDRGFTMRMSGTFTPIPEPSHSTLAATAVGILLARRRRD
jgi:hypothetical protein